jgi:hypothetical protein
VTVVIDVHEYAHARPRRADYLRESLLANLPNDRSALPSLPKFAMRSSALANA